VAQPKPKTFAGTLLLLASDTRITHAILQEGNDDHSKEFRGEALFVVIGLTQHVCIESHLVIPCSRSSVLV